MLSTPGLVQVFCLYMVAFASLVTVQVVWAGPYLHDVYNLDTVERGNVLLGMALVQTAGVLVVGPLDRLFNTRKWVSVGSACLALTAMTALALGPSSLSAAVGFLFLLSGSSAYGGVLFAQIRSLFPAHLAGRSATITNMAPLFGASVLPTLTGFIPPLFPHQGPGYSPLAYQCIFASLAFCLAAGLAIYLTVKDTKPRPSAGADPRPRGRAAHRLPLSKQRTGGAMQLAIVAHVASGAAPPYCPRQQGSSREDARMTDRLKGKLAFCTASGAGIGRATAMAFAREGAKVIASDLNEAAMAGLKEAGVAECVKLDARDTAAIEALAKRLGPVDVLFNAAGFVHHGTVLDTSDADWDFSFDLNVKSMHRTIKAFLPGMLAKGRGSIINIASAVGASKAAPNRYVYGATKAAVVGLTKAVAIDFIGKGIRCNCICPGTIQTPSLDDRVKALGKQVGGEDKARTMFIERQPMGRLGTAEEMAHIAVYLASDESVYTTGSAMLSDGGFTL